MHMEVQRKLHEQMEVETLHGRATVSPGLNLSWSSVAHCLSHAQKILQVQQHLQLRIEAQGKYLQTVLRKAQETLAGYHLDSLETEAAKAEHSELVSAVDTECLSSCASSSSLPRPQHADCSSDSCLTSMEKPGCWKADELSKLVAGSPWQCQNSGEGPDENSPEEKNTIEHLMIERPERGESIICSSSGEDNRAPGQPGCSKRPSQRREKSCRVTEEIDLNR